MRARQHILEVQPPARIVHVGGVGEMPAQMHQSEVLGEIVKRQSKTSTKCPDSWVLVCTNYAEDIIIIDTN